MIESLSQAELLWLPPRPDGISISYHFGHIALVEDMEAANAASQLLLATPALQDGFGVHNVNNRDARLPSGAAILEYAQAVRTRTLGLAGLRFRAIRSPEAAMEAAEVFRRMINHEYSHTKYIRRICAEMGKPPVGPPQSERVQANDQATAPPQYVIHHW